MSDIVYRLATISDIDALIRLRLALQIEEGHGDKSRAVELESVLREYFHVAIPSGAFLACVAELNGRIVAASGLVLHEHPPSLGNLSGREAYVMNMYTLPELRRRGIATELLRRVLELAREKRCPRVVLYALPKGMGIYRREGFVENAGSMRLELK